MKVAVPSASTTKSASTLCTQCGMCCSGAIHDRVAVEADEEVRLRALGFEVSSADIPAFPLPCPFHSGDLCSIYDQRPKSCARYRCQLLRDVEAGKVSMADARGIVNIAKGLMTEVLALFPAGAPGARSFARDAAAGTDRDQPDARAHLQALALMHHVDQHFRQPKEGHQLLSQALDMGSGQQRD